MIPDWFVKEKKTTLTDKSQYHSYSNNDNWSRSLSSASSHCATVAEYGGSIINPPPPPFHIAKLWNLYHFKEWLVIGFFIENILYIFLYVL